MKKIENELNLYLIKLMIIFVKMTTNLELRARIRITMNLC